MRFESQLSRDFPHRARTYIWVRFKGNPAIVRHGGLSVNEGLIDDVALTFDAHSPTDNGRASRISCRTTGISPQNKARI